MSGLARRTDSPLTLRRQKRLRPDRPCQRVVGVLSAHRMPGRSGVSPSEKRARLGFWQFCQCPLWAVRWLPPAAAGEALAAVGFLGILGLSDASYHAPIRLGPKTGVLSAACSPGFSRASAIFSTSARVLPWGR